MVNLGIVYITFGHDVLISPMSILPILFRCRRNYEGVTGIFVRPVGLRERPLGSLNLEVWRVISCKSDVRKI